MNVLIPIQYHKRKYPPGIEPKIREVAGNFDIQRIDCSLPFSLHTEYSFARRSFSSPALKGLTTIKNSHKNGIPQLWYNKKWATEFVDFIVNLTRQSNNLKIIEIHPPFNDYCQSIGRFIEIYKVFEDKILSISPETHILIENRFGSQYRGGKFIFSSNTDFVELAGKIEAKKCLLRMILDVPQLFTRHFGPKEKPKSSITSVLGQLAVCSGYIKGLHLWGKRRNDSGRWVSHSGNLDTYFDGNKTTKRHFLRELFKVLDDGKSRYFVPEVNSGDDDLGAIISDMIKTGFQIR